MKRYILAHEEKMQVVEDEVSRNMEYETHKFTQHHKNLDIERLELQYANKMETVSEVVQGVEENQRLREKIKGLLVKRKGEEW